MPFAFCLVLCFLSVVVLSCVLVLSCPCSFIALSCLVLSCLVRSGLVLFLSRSYEHIRLSVLWSWHVLALLCLMSWLRLVFLPAGNLVLSCLCLCLVCDSCLWSSSHLVIEKFSIIFELHFLRLLPCLMIVLYCLLSYL